MARKSWVVLIIFLIMALSGAVFAASPAKRPAYVPGELLLRFNDDVKQAVVDSAIGRVKGRIIRRFIRRHIMHVKVPAGTAKRAVNILKGLKGVKYAELNAFRYLNAIPNDAKFNNLWGLNNTGQTGGAFDADIDAPEAWNIITGSSAMVVADIDTGLDMAHEDIAANVYTNPGEIAGNGIDDDGNGFVDDVHGWDFAHNDNDPSDTDASCGGHGTHTAGTIGAVGNNGIGVAGVNWNVRLMPLKVFKTYPGNNCSATTSNIIRAINYASSMGVRVSNNSYGSSSFTQAEKDTIQASRSVFVAAAGNSGQNTDFIPQYPSAYDLPNIIAVAATDKNDGMAYFSNYGVSSVDLGAPGVGILSTTPGNTYSFFDGTSMATPHVVGAAALLMANDPTLTVNEIKWRILAGVDPISLPVGTGGRLNINNTLLLPPPIATVTMTPTGPTTVAPGGSISYSININNTDTAGHYVKTSLVVVLPNGREFTFFSRWLGLRPGTAVNANLTNAISPSLPPGVYDILGRVEVMGRSFDEDIISYTIAP